MFKDRLEAGRLLAAEMKRYLNDPGIVLAVPRGGVPVAYAVSKELGFPLEVVLTKKIGHPQNKEYAIGAASLTDYFIADNKDVSDVYIHQELLQIRTRLKEMYKKFMGDTPPAPLEGKTIIVIDDGMATGNTILSTVHVLRKGKPGKIVVGVPVASENAFHKIQKEVDDVIALTVPEEFYGVSAYYENFDQVSDEEVIYYLNKLAELKKAG